MKKIWKFPLTFETCKLNVPVGAEFIHFDMQGGNPTMWALVELTRSPMDPEKVTLRIVGTGHPIYDNEVYIGSCMDPPFVWHLVEVLPRQ